MSAQPEIDGKRPHWENGLQAMNAGRPLASLNGDASSILARLESGESAIDIAHSLGIHHTALYSWMIRHCPDDWQALQAARQLARLDDCEKVWDDSSTDGVTVSRTREKLKQACWHLERANRKLFGQDKGLSIQINNIQSIERVILTEAEVSDQPVIEGQYADPVNIQVDSQVTDK